MKNLRYKNITGFIFGLLLLMPFLSILARTCYVSFNRNAYKSYSNSVITGQTNVVNTINDLVIGNYYSFSRESEYVDTTNTSLQNININTNMFTIFDNAINYISFRYNTSDLQNFLRVRTIGTIGTQTVLTLQQAEQYNYQLNVVQYIGNINEETNFTIAANRIYYNSIYAFSIVPVLDLQYIPNIDTNPIDNVFDYSISKFVDDNNFGKVNLFNWFTDLFLDDNAHNNLYVHFINWYLNYSMLVSCMHLLFLVLMWFVNYSKRLLDRGMNYDW